MEILGKIARVEEVQRRPVRQVRADIVEVARALKIDPTTAHLEKSHELLQEYDDVRKPLKKQLVILDSKRFNL